MTTKAEHQFLNHIATNTPLDRAWQIPLTITTDLTNRGWIEPSTEQDAPTGYVITDLGRAALAERYIERVEQLNGIVYLLLWSTGDVTWGVSE